MMLRGDTSLYVGEEDLENVPSAKQTRAPSLQVHRLDAAVECLGQQHGLTDLYKDPDWSPDTHDTEGMKTTHFNSFFAERWGIRTQLSGGMYISDAVDTLIHGLRQIVGSRVWLRCFWALKLHIQLKIRMRTVCQERRKLRHQLLEEMLRYWQKMEKRKSSFIFESESAYILPEKAKQRSASYAHSYTPDSVKVMVLWEVYWMLRAQLCYNLSVFKRKRRELLATRERALELIALQCGGKACKSSNHLVEINVALFLLFLQAPKLQFTPKHLPFPTLVSLARQVTSSEFGALAPRCFATFMALPICNAPNWLQKRFVMAGLPALVPPLSWDPTGFLNSSGPAAPEQPAAPWGSVRRRGPPPPALNEAAVLPKVSATMPLDAGGVTSPARSPTAGEALSPPNTCPQKSPLRSNRGRRVFSNVGLPSVGLSPHNAALSNARSPSAPHLEESSRSGSFVARGSSPSILPTASPSLRLRGQLVQQLEPLTPALPPAKAGATVVGMPPVQAVLVRPFQAPHRNPPGLMSHPSLYLSTALRADQTCPTI